MDKIQQSIVHLGDNTKSRNCTDLDYIDALGKLKFTRNQIQYLKQLVKEVRQLDGQSNAGTETDQLLNYFESTEGCRYTVLYNDPSSLDVSYGSEILVNDPNDVLGKGDIIASAVNYSSDEQSAIRKFCITQRNSILYQGQYKIVIGIVWTLD
eukprot:9366008-Ditylum_brightwellii.AAC.1